MKRLLRNLVFAASLIAIMASGKFAQALQLRNISERHQHPGHGFFVKHPTSAFAVSHYRH